jgi:hypothetical protein
MLYLTWHNIIPETKKETKLAKLGYVGLSCCGVSPYQHKKIIDFIKSCDNDIYHTIEWFDDTDIDYVNNCYGIWFEKKQDRILFEQLLASFPKREHYIIIDTADEKDIKKQFKKIKMNDDAMLYERKYYNSSYCLSTSSKDIAVNFKLSFG